MSAPTLDSTIDTIWLFVSVLLKLGIVLVLMYASLSLLRRWKFSPSALMGKQLALLETLHLAPHQRLHLVRAGNKHLLIGTTEKDLTILTEVELSQALMAEVLSPQDASTDREVILPAWLTKPSLSSRAAQWLARRLPGSLWGNVPQSNP